MFAHWDAPGAVLYALDEAVSCALSAALEGLGWTAERHDQADASDCAALVRRSGACAVFFGGGGGSCRELRNALGELAGPPALIAVSREPAPDLWLDALDAGADDYCAQPFDSTQLRWLLEGARLRPAVAYVHKTDSRRDSENRPLRSCSARVRSDPDRSGGLRARASAPARVPGSVEQESGSLEGSLEVELVDGATHLPAGREFAAGSCACRRKARRVGGTRPAAAGGCRSAACAGAFPARRERKCAAPKTR